MRRKYGGPQAPSAKILTYLYIKINVKERYLAIYKVIIVFVMYFFYKKRFPSACQVRFFIKKEGMHNCLKHNFI
jgi:hypothetical protein